MPSWTSPRGRRRGGVIWWRRSLAPVALSACPRAQTELADIAERLLQESTGSRAPTGRRRGDGWERSLPNSPSLRPHARPAQHTALLHGVPRPNRLNCSTTGRVRRLDDQALLDDLSPYALDLAEERLERVNASDPSPRVRIPFRGLRRSSAEATDGDRFPTVLDQPSIFSEGATRGPAASPSGAGWTGGGRPRMGGRSVTLRSGIGGFSLRSVGPGRILDG
jgi:hypothetical protein